jgi:hypothetical protein
MPKDNETWTEIDLKDDNGKDKDIILDQIDENLEEDEVKETKSQPTEVEEEDFEGESKVSDRIRKLIAKAKAESDKAAAIQAQLLEKEQEIQGLKQGIQSIHGRMSEGAKNVKKTLKENKEAQIQQIKRTLRQAVDAGDAEGQVEAQDSLARLYSELSAIDNASDEVELPRINRPQGGNKGQRFMANNPLFTNSVFKAAAMTIDAELKESGLSPHEDSYYDILRDRLRQEFPDKKDKIHSLRVQEEDDEEEKEEKQEKLKKRAAATSGRGISRETTQTGVIRVRPTKEDESMAKRLGLDLKDYMREKIRVDKAGSGYVVIG